MRILFIAFLLLINSSVFAQSNFNSLIKGYKITPVPYSSESDQNEDFPNNPNQKYLNSNDSAFVIASLNSIPRTIVNPKGGTSFGDLDCLDASGCYINTSQKIALLAITKSPTSQTYCLHIEVEESGAFGMWYGILACFTTQGKLTSWIYARGSANTGNTAGNIFRSFKIGADNNIRITENAWGDRSDSYSFNATLKVIANKFVVMKRKLNWSKIDTVDQ